MPTSDSVVVLVGRPTRDLHVRTQGDKPSAYFVLAMNRTIQNQDGTKGRASDFIPVKVFGDIATTAARAVHRGDLVYVRGSLRSWRQRTPEGQQHDLVYVVGYQVLLLRNPAGREDDPGASGPGADADAVGVSEGAEEPEGLGDDLEEDDRL